MKWIIVAVLCATAGQASATMTGNFLLTQCRAETRACAFYVAGVVEGIEMVTGTHREVSFTRRDGTLAVKVLNFCVPTGASPKQMRDVVASYLEERPEIRHERASLHVFKAMQNAFPCE